MSAFTQHLLRIVAEKFPESIFFVETKKPLIALTIDDVGDNSTQLIIDKLKEYNQESQQLVKATFFITTSYLQNPQQLITNILAQGHEIGNHGVYDRSHYQLTSTEFKQEIIQAHQTLQKYTQTPVKWFRPARGRYNPSMLVTLHNMSQEYDYIPKFALASDLPLDTFSATNSPPFTFKYLSQFIFPGAIFVLHGGTELRAKNTIGTLSLLLPYLHKLGYQVVTLTELVNNSSYNPCSW
ncbi:MAG: hypothetical protein EA365_06505 [Gloeocapsa sp. DLM2.Bin57]|nr:MAG: hypothetical protein EA365_06505 [Gloeocapsa sp. DLM2.Bin57]